MASILGLEEQKAALRRVKDNLGEIRKINGYITNLKEYIAQAKEQEYTLECKFVLENDSLTRLRVPVTITDSDFIFNALKEHKREIVKQIKEDTSKYHIALSQQEEASLFGDTNAES